jgi:hypothetical protein
VAKSKAPPPTPEERQAATEATLYAQTIGAKKVLAGLAMDARSNDHVVRAAAQKLFLESWLAVLNRSEVQQRMDKLIELMDAQQQRDPLP